MNKEGAKTSCYFKLNHPYKISTPEGGVPSLAESVTRQEKMELRYSLHRLNWCHQCKQLKDLGRLYRFYAQSLSVSGSFCVNLKGKLLHSP